MNDIERLAEDAGGRITEVLRLPDGSGAAIMELPLPADHWLTAPNKDGVICEPPPMLMLRGTRDPRREEYAKAIEAAVRYALRVSTNNGTEDYDPDALVRNAVIGCLGYETHTGLSEDQWANPEHLRIEVIDPDAPQEPSEYEVRDYKGEL